MGLNLLLLSKQVSLFPRRRRAPGSGKGQIVAEAANAFRIICRMRTPEMPEVAAAAPVFRAQGLTKTYHMGDVQVRALRGVDLALERGELQLHYQPKIDARLGRLQGVEALLRWQHPTRGMVGPNVFIPIAERFGLINGLGNWVIEESCRQMRVWADEGLSMNVAINLSVHQLRTEELVPRIESALARYQVMPSQLLCEITESVAMEDIESTQRAFEALSRIGVYLSIDDFGTGYSSLSYLRQLPARQLKIDRSFVADIEVRPDARAIVGAVIQLAHQLGLRVVAEGVETEGQRDILLLLQCDELQGYLLARPMAVEALDDWLQKLPPDAPHPAVGARDEEVALMKDDVGEILV